MDKILLVDDDTVTLRFLEHLLVDHHFFVLTAQDGEAALDLAIKEKPWLVIIDFILPKIDGGELCRRIKQDPDLKRTKVILMSAVYQGSHLKSVGGDCGADAFVGKPIRSTELLEKIYKLSTEADSPEKKEGHS
jgi:two-component system cell cycle response regulator